MAKDILEEIVAWKRIEVEQAKQRLPLSQLAQAVERQVETEATPPPSMRQALEASPTGIIAEFKRRSPSRGWIHQEAQAPTVTLDYERGGAAAVSILTDVKYFGGDDTFVTASREAGLRLPVLYKNFVVDEYQVYQARRCGASAVLLIAADLTLRECAHLQSVAHRLGMETLLEMHSESELHYADIEPDLCGINNRHLGTFVTDVQTSFDMARHLPPGACKVSESGISNPDTVRALRTEGYRGFLIGECFMKTSHPGDTLRQFVSAITSTPTPQ